MAKKYKILVVVSIVLIVCNIFAKIFILDEQAHKISLLQKELSAARNETSVTVEKKLTPAETLEKEMKSGVEKTLGQIPAALLFTESAAKLRRLVDTNHLTVEDSLVFRPEKTKMPALVKYHTRFSVNGEYKNIKGFISDLQNVPGLLYLESVKIVRVTDTEPLLKLSLGIHLFFRTNSVRTGPVRPGSIKKGAV
jgi:Tfp pilus assembly protein PilO